MRRREVVGLVIPTILTWLDYPAFVERDEHIHDTMSGSDLTADVEKHPANGFYEDNSGAVPGETFEYGDSLYAKLQRFAGKLNVEQRGIERVPDNERTDTSYLNVGSMVRYS